MDELILVDRHGNEIGYADKLSVHRGAGQWHRAFSIFLFDHRGRWLLQQRAACKYHFAGLWSNACCGHPLRGETTPKAAARRLHEELGIRTELTERFVLPYEATDPVSGLHEREFDHVLTGRHDGPLEPAPSEIDAVRWIDVRTLPEELERTPELFTPWFKLLILPVLGWWLDADWQP